MSVTQDLLKSARYEGTSYQGRNGRTVWSRCVIWDDDTAGLGLRITPTGKKHFILRYRAGSRQRLMRLGAFGVLTLKTARVKARKYLAQVDEGRDPLAERKAAAKAATVNEFADRYLEDHAKVKKKPTSVQGDRQILRDYVKPKLGHLAVTEITRQDVTALHQSLRDKPYQANRVLALVSKMLNLAERWGLRPVGSNPCRHVEKFKEPPRERYLSTDEFGRLATAISTAEEEETESVHALAALRLLILTGCRLREILRLRWEHVDLQTGRLLLPDSKTGAKTVFLSTTARELLERLPRTESNPWVIEGRKLKSHLTDLKGPWRRICAAAKIKDLRIHDLRHSYAAIGAGLGMSLPMIGALLGHTQPRTTARYAHLAADPMHEAADQIGAQLVAVMATKRESGEQQRPPSEPPQDI